MVCRAFYQDKIYLAFEVVRQKKVKLDLKSPVHIGAAEADIMGSAL